MSRIHNSSLSPATRPSPSRQSIDAKEIGKELGVRYVLEGLRSARTEPRARQRATYRCRNRRASLGPTASGKTWPICSSCKIKWWRDGDTMGIELVKAEAERAPAPRTPTPSISPCAAGRCCIQRLQQPSKDNYDAARALFEQASRSTPTNADALAGDATYYMMMNNLRMDNSETDYDAKYSVRPTGHRARPR